MNTAPNLSSSNSDNTPKYTTYTYKIVDDLKIEADVFLPTTSPYSKYPVIFHIHGGGNVAGTKLKAINYIQRDEMLRRGWCVISINYRLGPAAFLEEIMEDIQDAYKWVRTELVKEVPINIEAIALWGSSSGGCLVAISGYMLNPRPRAMVALYPFATDLTDPASFDPSTPVSKELAEKADSLRQHVAEAEIVTSMSDPRFWLFITAMKERKLGWLIATPNPDEPAENVLRKLRKYSAVYHVDEDYPATCLVHGTSDTVASYQLSVDMAKALEAKNVPHKLILAPGIEHAFDFKMHKSEEWPQVWENYVVPAFDFAEFHMTRNVRREGELPKESSELIMERTSEAPTSEVNTLG